MQSNEEKSRQYKVYAESRYGVYCGDRLVLMGISKPLLLEVVANWERLIPHMTYEVKEIA